MRDQINDGTLAGAAAAPAAAGRAVVSAGRLGGTTRPAHGRADQRGRSDRRDGRQPARATQEQFQSQLLGGLNMQRAAQGLPLLASLSDPDPRGERAVRCREARPGDGWTGEVARHRGLVAEHGWQEVPGARGATGGAAGGGGAGGGVPAAHRPSAGTAGAPVALPVEPAEAVPAEVRAARPAPAAAPGHAGARRTRRRRTGAGGPGTGRRVGPGSRGATGPRSRRRQSAQPARSARLRWRTRGSGPCTPTPGRSSGPRCSARST